MTGKYDFHTADSADPPHVKIYTDDSVAVGTIYITSQVPTAAAELLAQAMITGLTTPDRLSKLEKVKDAAEKLHYELTSDPNRNCVECGLYPPAHHDWCSVWALSEALEEAKR